MTDPLENLGKRRHFVYELYQLYTDGMQYTVGRQLHINRRHARQVQKSLCFNYSVWMNTFCHTVYCMLHTCAVEQKILSDLRHSRNINNMTQRPINFACLSLGAAFHPVTKRNVRPF